MSVPVVQCRAKARTGTQCKNKAIPGGTVCRFHGGASRHVASKAAVRAEVMNWGLDDKTADPGETLLKLVTQSAARAQRYASELDQKVVAAGGDLESALIHKGAFGESVRALVKLEAEERDRCANFATKAIAAGLNERLVRLAEAQGAMLAQAIRLILGDLGLSSEQQERAPEVVRARLLELTSDKE